MPLSPRLKNAAVNAAIGGLAFGQRGALVGAALGGIGNVGFFHGGRRSSRLRGGSNVRGGRLRGGKLRGGSKIRGGKVRGGAIRGSPKSKGCSL